MVHECEDMIGISDSAEDGRHHKQVASVQALLAKNVHTLVEVIDELGNPFVEDSGDLYCLYAKNVMSDFVVKTIKEVTTVGMAKYEEFVNANDKWPSQQKYQISSLETNYALFSRLVMVCQTRVT